MDCVFCKIVSGEIPAKKAYEDEKILAFHDLRPQAPVHILVIPKKHIASLEDVDTSNSSIVGYIFENIPKIACIAGVCNGYRVICNCGEDGRQTINHLHFHILGGASLPENMG